MASGTLSTRIGWGHSRSRSTLEASVFCRFQPGNHLV